MATGDSSRIVSIAQAQEHVSQALMRMRTAEVAARSVAVALVSAEMIGQVGHGLRRTTAYAAQAASGKINGYAIPKSSILAPGLLAIDAGHGFAFPALELAIERLPKLVERQGIAAAAIRRSHHCGALGLIAEQLAKRGLAALVLANTPAAIAPWGGRTPLFGTNPIAFAVPIEEDEPLVMDLSLSKVARGKVMAAHQKAEQIPADWAFDSKGNPTTDPAEALAGTMAPAGEAKGAVLALMIELLVAGIGGANFAFEASSFFDSAGPPPGVGQFIIAIDPIRLGGWDTFRRIAELARRIELEPGARLPGQYRQAMRREATNNGIAVETALLETIDRIGVQTQ